MVERPGRQQSVSAAQAVSARGGFWSCTYEGALTAELFVTLLERMMAGRDKPVHRVIDGVPAHKTKWVKDYAALSEGKATVHILQLYAPDLNPDELV